VTDGGSVVHSYVYDPGSDSWSSMADMPVGLWGSGYTAAEGKLLVSGGVTNNNSTITNQGFSLDPTSNTWPTLPNSNITEYRGGSACGFYKVGGIPGGFAAPLDSAEVLPGNVDCADVPGTHMAKLVVGTDTPYAVPAVQASMTVTPPKTWGKITGTVSGPSGPLAGATVQIVSGVSNLTLRTDRNGVYEVWLPARNDVRAIASKNGFVSQARTGLKIKPGEVTVVDFLLSTA
jgi:carboxypeptidase family protein